MRNCSFLPFSLSLHCVKLCVLIFSFLLSFLSTGREESVSICSSKYPATEKAIACAQNREVCLSAAQGYAFSGSNSTNSVSVRVNQSFRRINEPVRSAFRMVKGGKVVDNNHLHPFLARSFVHLTGLFISDRFLYSICRLRL